MIIAHPDLIDGSDPEIRALAHRYKMGFANGEASADSANAAFRALMARGIVPWVTKEGWVILGAKERLNR